jgi:hypothetical protein
MIVDTSALLALFDTDEPEHEAVSAIPQGGLTSVTRLFSVAAEPLAVCLDAEPDVGEDARIGRLAGWWQVAAPAQYGAHLAVRSGQPERHTTGGQRVA